MRQFLSRHPKLDRLAKELGKFGSVGAVAYVVQIGVTNLLWQVAGAEAITGQLIGTLCSIAVAFVGNRFWTFRDRARTGYWRETLLFLAMNGVGMLIQLACLGVAVYLLGLSGPLAQNIAGNVVGVGLGTLFRFWSYRTWVFPLPPEPEPSAPAATDPAEGPAVRPVAEGH
ncbi:putative flippase GtrA [Nocardiopsis sp. Huas11]|uniref:GtrA family protein n=1 Tax=Nocardiopsis sp. Huas11 TaxID=2183912 RepID=UPI000EB117F8|nr:GtrA family protein [Nocardiopsis sp. Huas11]RKS05496.1 putative flippase GtrA [Nocardiopsis sp. Huas11]